MKCYSSRKLERKKAYCGAWGTLLALDVIGCLALFVERFMVHPSIIQQDFQHTQKVGLIRSMSGQMIS